MNINGTKVVDAKKAIVLEITPKDIAKGNNKNPSACAAAQACMRQLGATEARVHIGRTYLRVGENWQRFQTSKALRSEIVAFDRGGTFEPGTYTLNPLRPTELKRMGRRQGSDKPGARDRGSKNRTPAKPRAKPHAVTGIRAHGANR